MHYSSRCCPVPVSLPHLSLVGPRCCRRIVLDKGSSQNDKDRAERLLLSARKFDVIRLSIILSFLLIFVVGMPLLWRWCGAPPKLATRVTRHADTPCRHALPTRRVAFTGVR